MDTTVDVSKAVIETDRLILRAWQESDADDFFEYASVDGVGEMAGWKHHETIEDSRKILCRFISDKNQFAIVLKDTGKVIGSLGLHYSWANDDEKYKNLSTKEIGYVLSKAHWGKGLMPEAVKAVICFCFNECGIAALTCGHFSVNAQSKRVIEKCGFLFVGSSDHYEEQLNQSFKDMKYLLLALPTEK